jgi:hypothetical protein
VYIYIYIYVRVCTYVPVRGGGWRGVAVPSWLSDRSRWPTAVLYVYVCILNVFIYVCVCVYVWVREIIYICVCVCGCVWVWVSVRERVFIYICICMYVCERERGRLDYLCVLFCDMCVCVSERNYLCVFLMCGWVGGWGGQVSACHSIGPWELWHTYIHANTHTQMDGMLLTQYICCVCVLDVPNNRCIYIYIIIKHTHIYICW